MTHLKAQRNHVGADSGALMNGVSERQDDRLNAAWSLDTGAW